MFDRINEDLKESLKSGDKFKLSVLRMLKSALQLEAINNKKELTDEVVINVIKKSVKQRNDSLEEYKKLGKDEVASDLEKEIEILKVYLPEEATEEEIENCLNAAFDEIKPSSMKDMGSIMKYVSSHLANVDMTKVSAKVKEKLNN